MTNYSGLTPEELIQRADSGSPYSPDAQHCLHVAEVKVAIRANELNGRLLDSQKATREVEEKQLIASQEANELTRKLLESNQKTSEQGERTAKSMNNATIQLADSTKSLNRATWVLVTVTAVQALTAIAALYISISSHK